MIVDYLHGSAPTDATVDLCIVGAGAAGLAIAKTFVGTQTSVCLIESGGLAGEERSQALAGGLSIGSPALDPGVSRMRVFGGSCTLWGGGCIPLSAQDLEARAWVPHSGWPLTYAELEPYYQQARGFCGLEGHTFAEGSFLTRPAHAPLVLDSRTLINQVFARSPLLFGEGYRAELAQAANVTVLLHANVLELSVDAAGSAVSAAQIGSLDGRRGSVRARHYVLACGGVENARLLLLSRSVIPQGLGNERDLVGRFFMDHPSGKLGTVFTERADRLTRPYDRTLGKGASPAFSEIGLSSQAQQAHGLLNGRVHPYPVEAPPPRGIRALRGLRAALRQTPRDESSLLAERLCLAMHNGPSAAGDTSHSTSIGRLALQVGLGAGDIAKALARKIALRPTVQSHHVELHGFFEQAPNPDSRITLGRECDVLGQPEAAVDWRLTALDRHTYRTAATMFGTELARACDGSFQIEPWLGEDGAPQVHGTAHHMGTTRMADDPQQGVVDRHCRVHGVENLHIAGSSVFPTGGWAFPTFTIVALSLRLAEHLRIHALPGPRPKHTPSDARHPLATGNV
jgi:choline dehydrogenase-like flavoprotein